MKCRSDFGLDEERGDLDSLARRLGYIPHPTRFRGAPRPARGLRQHTSAIRGVYLRIMGIEAPPRWRRARRAYRAYRPV